MKIKNVSGTDRLVPALGGRLVLAGQQVDVSEADVYAFTQQSLWEPADDEAQAAHDSAASTFEAVEEVATDPAATPAGNASREVWAAWAVATNRATEDELDGLGRDEIRDTYSNDGSI